MTINTILKNYGFEVKNGTLFWGIGSLVWGHVVEVNNLGNDLYKVKYHTWEYNSWGDCVKDEQSITVLHGARALQFVVEKVPIFSNYRP